MERTSEEVKNGIRLQDGRIIQGYPIQNAVV